MIRTCVRISARRVVSSQRCDGTSKPEPTTGAVGSKRLDVVERTDATHPRVHRHPFGCPNHMREATHVTPPEQWLSFVDTVLAGALGDHLLTWDQDAED